MNGYDVSRLGPPVWPRASYIMSESRTPEDAQGMRARKCGRKSEGCRFDGARLREGAGGVGVYIGGGLKMVEA